MAMHTQILENLHALLDFNHVPRNLCERSKYFSELFGIELQESENLLEGAQVPNRKLLHAIANKFEVDPRWLLEN